jgi:hypothetical protein
LLLQLFFEVKDSPLQAVEGKPKEGSDSLPFGNLSQPSNPHGTQFFSSSPTT